jgi:hypothetical protein
MPVTVHVVEGPLKGTDFELKAGMRLGRSSADVNLKDPKVSSIHCEIRLRTGSVNSLVLFDLGSTNGIKVNGKRVSSLDLAPELEFQLGNTLLRVTAVEEVRSGEGPSVELSDWRVHLLRVASKMISTPKQRVDVRLFDPMLVLNFLEGPLKGECVALGYGPRTIGKLSSELSLNDPRAADVTFELAPESRGEARFHTENSGRIRLNGLFKDTETIKTGDRIETGQTVIEISFDENQTGN